MKIAIVGAGISGNTIAHLLHKEHKITVFEKNDRIGGHSHTHKVQLEGKVVVEITVDQLGNVINAIAGVKGSTTLNEQLIKRAREAALKTKFSPKESAPSRQQGKIIYNFQLN